MCGSAIRKRRSSWRGSTDDLLDFCWGAGDRQTAERAPRFSRRCRADGRSWPRAAIPGRRQKGPEYRRSRPRGRKFPASDLHAGTRRRGDAIVADGGRVLAITAIGADVAEAHARPMRLSIVWTCPEGFCRRDIGARALGTGGGRNEGDDQPHARLDRRFAPPLSRSPWAAAARAGSRISSCSRRWTNSASTRSPIAGCSIGAIVGAAYAAGMTAQDIHEHVGSCSAIARRSWRTCCARASAVFPISLQGRRQSGAARRKDLPRSVLARPGARPFQISWRFPFFVVATDFHACREVVFSSGALAPAVAGSMAIPGCSGRWNSPAGFLVDGGAVNPLPYDLLFDHADIVVAVDVTFGGRMRERRMPTPVRRDVREPRRSCRARSPRRRSRSAPPDILLRPPVERFAVLEFLRADQILARRRRRARTI